MKTGSSLKHNFSDSTTNIQYTSWLRSI